MMSTLLDRYLEVENRLNYPEQCFLATQKTIKILMFVPKVLRTEIFHDFDWREHTSFQLLDVALQLENPICKKAIILWPLIRILGTNVKSKLIALIKSLDCVS